ncbi:hypothetical protein TNCV_1507471 [Trichonephila clavipes]|nr:hypothetical protein TNCV_1507471 [Trichonephila clavipes]
MPDESVKAQSLSIGVVWKSEKSISSGVILATRPRSITESSRVVSKASTDLTSTRIIVQSGMPFDVDLRCHFPEV